MWTCENLQNECWVVNVFAKTHEEKKGAGHTKVGETVWNALWEVSTSELQDNNWETNTRCEIAGSFVIPESEEDEEISIYWVEYKNKLKWLTTEGEARTKM